jgi:hypothetical protein
MKTNWLVVVLVATVLGLCAVLLQSQFVVAEKLSPETTIKTEDGDVGINPTDEETEQLRDHISSLEASSGEAYPPNKMEKRGDFVLGVVFALDTMIYTRNDAARHATADKKKGLAGIEAVTVTVDVQSNVKEYGLTQQLLQTDTELRLRQEGIRVLTAEEVDRSVTNAQEKQQERWQDLALKMISLPEALAQNDPDEHFWRSLRPLIPEYLRETCGPSPYLSVNLHPIVSEKGGFTVFSVDLELNDAVYVRRNGALRVAAIWETGALAACQSSELEEHARECLRDCLDEFINDYLAANPKDCSGQK